MPTQKDQLKIITFSDLHISKFSGFFNEEAFKTGIMNIANELKSYPEAIVLNLGDITDEGTYEDYTYANMLINGAFSTFGIKNPVIHYLPGNHDFRNIGMEIWKEYYGFRHFFIDTTIHEGNVVILGIDSVEPDTNSGRIGNRGIEAILTKFSPFPDDVVKILCFHHHLVPTPHTGRERSTIIDAGDLMPVLWESGVDIVIVGHRHYPNSFSISNGKRRILLLNNGTFSSNKTRGKAGHVYLTLDISKEEIVEKFIGIDVYSTFQKPKTIVHPLERGNIPCDPIEKKSDKIIVRICQLGCTHISHGSDFQDDVYEQGMKMLISEKPSLIIHCGNLTNDSYPEDFIKAKNYLNHLREANIPIILVPGTRDLQPYGKKLWVKYIGSLDPIYDNDGSLTHVFGINTGPDTNGNVGRSSLNLLENDLKTINKNKLIVVAMHHSCLPIPRSSFERTVKNAGDALEFFSLNRIPLILSGLEHYATSLQIRDTLFVNAGTFSSKKIKSKKMNTFNVITVYDNGIVEIEEIEIHSGFRHHLGSYRTPFLSNS
ncbi:MAG: metallophosphoesterase family protein [Candidatus Hodarchaeota archaeon]